MPDFGIADVLGDAFRSWWRRIGTHLGFNALFLVVLFLSLCLFGCVFAIMAGGTVAALSSGGTAPDAEGMGAMLGVMGVMYAVMIAVMLVAMAFHHAFSLQVGGEDMRGGQPNLSTGMRASAPRLLPHLGSSFLRFAIDMVVFCVTFGAVIAIARQMDSAPAPASADPFVNLVGSLSRFPIAVGGAYVVQLAWFCVVRAFLGMAGCAVQLEGMGPIDALRRSVELLDGRRLKFVGVRVVWGLVFFVVAAIAYAPMIGVMFVAGGMGNPSDANPAMAILMLPLLIAFYGLMFMLYSFDSQIEVAFYVRSVPSQVPGAQVAQVFR